MWGRALGFSAFAAAVYTVVLVFFLWPWPADPARLGINNADLLLGTWVMAWVVHQGFNDPRHLLDANMFWPQSGVLANNDTLFPQSIMAAPVFWLGGGPLLAHNLVLFATILLSGVTAALLTLRLTRSRGAALTTGFAYAFCPFRFDHLVQINVASYQWFPLVILALWDVAAGSSRSRRTSLILLTFAALLQALTSGYYAVLLALVLIPALAFLGRRLWRKGRLGSVLAGLAIAAVIALAAGLPSLMIRGRQTVSRGPEAPIHWSAVPRSYVDPGPSVPALGLSRWIERTPEPLFPGFVATGFALVGLARARNKAARSLLLWVGFVCAAMAAGPILRDLPFELSGPFELARRVPPVDMIRVPSRFGIVAILAIDVLAGLGFAAIERRFSARRRALFTVAVLSFMTVELRPAIAYSIQPVPPPPPYTSALASLPRGGVLALPWRREESAGPALYWSTAHWQPLVNGYATFSVTRNFQLAAMAQNFPTGFAARVLRCAGVRYVVVHGAEVPDPQRARALNLDVPGVTLLGKYREDFLFELTPWTPEVPCPKEMPEGVRRR